MKGMCNELSNELRGCDNTDCADLSKEYYFVMLIEDHDNSVCFWCKECIERDSDMILIDSYNKKCLRHLSKKDFGRYYIEDGKVIEF